MNPNPHKTIPEIFTQRKRLSLGSHIYALIRHISSLISPSLPLVFLVFFSAEVTLQYLSGAFRQEFGSFPDEAGHFLTGLMIRDFIAGLQWTDPMRFAEEYYIHYPKVALGHWPPLFYLVQAAWMLLFSPSRLSVMLLMALLTSCLAVIVYLSIRREFNSFVGMLGGILLIALPIIQAYSGMLMAEILLTLLSFCAVLCFGRYLDTQRWQAVIGFGIFASLAIMTKGNALALVLVPPLAGLSSRRLYLLTRPAFWCAAMIVFVSCVPWYWFTIDMVRNGCLGTFSLSYMQKAIPFFASRLINMIGIGITLLSVIGFWAQVIKPFRDGGASGKWAAAGALVLSVLIFHCMTACSLYARHLISALPGILLLSVAGIVSVSDWGARVLEHRKGFRHVVAKRRLITILAAATILVFSMEAFTIPKEPWRGFGAVAQRLLTTPGLQHSTFLISSGPHGEGMFVAEIAIREQRPNHIVLRGSKVLATSRWDGRAYKTLFRTPEEIMRYLEEIPVEIVIIDRSVSAEYRTEDQRLLRRTLEVYPERWIHLGSYPLTRRGVEYADAIQIYRQVGVNGSLPGSIRINMEHMLNRDLIK